MPITGYSNTISLTTSAPSFDPDAQAFFDRVTTAGGTLTAPEQTATNSLVVQMKFDGIWNSMKAIYPMVGASAAACAQNLKSSSFTGTFTSGWTFASSGVTGNGTSAYMNTTLLSNDFTEDKGGYSCYTRNLDIDTTLRIQYGSLNSGWVLSWMNIKAFALNQSGGYKEFSTLPIGYLGLVINQRLNNTDVKINFSGGNQILSSNISTTEGANTIYLGAWGNGEGGLYHSTRQIAFFAKHDLIDESGSVNLINAVQAFQTTLGRQV